MTGRGRERGFPPGYQEHDPRQFLKDRKENTTNCIYQASSNRSNSPDGSEV